MDRSIQVGKAAVGRGGHYVTKTKLIHTTVLRTVTTKVPQTIIKTRNLVSTINYSPTTTTLLRTSVVCLKPTYSNENSYEGGSRYKFSSGQASSEIRGSYQTPKKGKSNGNSYSLPTPPLTAQYKSGQNGHYKHSTIHPTSSYESDPSLYRTWLGSFVDKGDSYKDSDESAVIPSQFILLQHMWPKGFIVGDGYHSNEKTHFRLRHISDLDERSKRTLPSRVTAAKRIVPNNARNFKPILLSPSRQ